MSIYLAELIGTFILVLLGNGVVANVILNKTKGHGSGWILITAGWGSAVFCAVLCVGEISGAHLNPAVTIGLAAADQFEFSQVPGYLAAQMAGAFLGACVVYVLHKSHYDETPDPAVKLATFSTGPAIKELPRNLACEAIATFVLVYAVLCVSTPTIELVSGEPTPIGLGTLGAIPVGLVVFSIGMCLGGPTGYAINPARDLGPRIAHAVLPIPGKGDSDWQYAAVPVVGPILGGLLAAGLYLATT